MATNYPGAIDSLTNPSAGDALTSPSHSAQHANANDAIEAIETELGTTPSGSESTVAARLTAIENGTRMGTGSIGATQLADSAVDTAAIQDGAVTPAKLATSGRFTFPTGAANGYGFASGAVHLSGTGTPGGVVTAAPGSTWLQTDSTTDVKGWIKWVKATGTGNTGWIAGPEADTGWRALTLEGDWTGTAYLLRVGRRVTFKFINLTGTATTGAYTLPAGFRLGAPGAGAATRLAANGNSAGMLEISSTAGANKVEPLSGARQYPGTYIEVPWITDDAWPSSLPGSAA